MLKSTTPCVPITHKAVTAKLAQLEQHAANLREYIHTREMTHKQAVAAYRSYLYGENNAECLASLAEFLEHVRALDQTDARLLGADQVAGSEPAWPQTQNQSALPCMCSE